MFNSKKLLSVVFVILFVVLLGEIGYIVYSTYSRRPATGGNETSSNLAIENGVSPVVEERNGEQAIPESTMKGLSYINRGVVTSLTAQGKYQGKIIELDNTDELRIRVEGLEGETNTFIFDQVEVPQISVFKQNEQNIAETAVLSDLQVGQAIVMEHSINLLQDLNINTITIKITILNP